MTDFLGQNHPPATSLPIRWCALRCYHCYMQLMRRIPSCIAQDACSQPTSKTQDCSEIPCNSRFPLIQVSLEPGIHHPPGHGHNDPSSAPGGKAWREETHATEAQVLRVNPRWSCRVNKCSSGSSGFGWVSKNFLVASSFQVGNGFHRFADFLTFLDLRG